MDLLSKNQRPSSTSDQSSGVSLRLDEDSSVPDGSINENPVSNTPNPGVMERYHKIVKSEADKRFYRGLLLTNRMKVLLVSDPTVDIAAAALEVQVGSFNDPDEIPGLAHFCEHMMFLGTEKYPQENEFDKFLSENGGWSNAATRYDNTMFYFTVTPPHLKKALDIFAQFFISPLFTESATDRELNAVNSEHESNLCNDIRRLHQIVKQICDVKHPFRKFATGTKETLQSDPESKGINVREELLKFHGKWYSANIMSLVVIGKESLDELEAAVAPLFSVIEDKSVTAPSWPNNPFPPELRRKKVYGIPINDTQSLDMVFPVPYTYCANYKSRPGRYLAYLIHHEGPGSLHSALKKRGWCDNILSGEYIPARGYGFFEIAVALTQEGINRIDDIVILVFQYIAMLKVKGPQEWVWQECKKRYEINFRFKDTPNPEDFVEDYVGLLQEYPIEDVLSAYYLNPEWKPELITEMLSYLSPEHVNIYIAGQAFEDKCIMTVPRYGTKYWVENIDEIKLKEWKEVQLNEELHLPPPNDFILSNLSLDKSLDPTCYDIAPAIIKDTKLMRIWYKKDDEFLLPKAMITLHLVSPLAYLDPTNACLTEMLVENLSDSLQEIVYSAHVGGLSLSVTRNPEYGINITVEGYDDKIHVLLDIILDRLLQFKAQPKRFEIKSEAAIRGFKNIGDDQPSEIARIEQSLCLSNVTWPVGYDLDAVQDLTPKQLEEFAANFIRKVHIEGLMYGNLSRKRALQIADAVEQKFPKDGTPLMAEHLFLKRDIELDKGVWYVREIQNSVHCSSCACLYYGCGENETKSYLMLSLLVNLLSEPCYTTLRTNEQLGYVVNSTSFLSNGYLGLRVTVQSDRHPYILEQRIEAFVQSFLKCLQDMSDEEFSKHKEAVLSRILEKPKQMSSKFHRMWSEIYKQVYNFDRERIEMEHLKTIIKDDVVQFYKKHLSADSSERQKLSVYVVSTAEGGAGNESAEDSKEEVDQEDLNKELHEKETDQSNKNNPDEIKPENYVIDEIESMRTIINDLDENKNVVIKPNQTDLTETKDDKGPEKEESDEKVSEQNKSKKPFDISTLQTDKEEQLGYMVNSTSSVSNDSLGLSVTVQSDKHPYIPEQRIESFVQSLLKYLQDMSDEELSNIEEETSRMLEQSEVKSKLYREICEIYNEEYNGEWFDMEHVQELTKDGLLQYFKEALSTDSPVRQKLSVFLISFVEGEADNEIAEHPKQIPDQEDLNKELHEKETDQSNKKNPEEIKPENYVLDEIESVRPIIDDLDENKNGVNKSNQADLIETKEGKGSDKEESEEKVLEQKKSKKPFDISTLQTDKELEIITDLLEFKSRRRLYPNPKPFMNIPRKGI